MRTAEERRAALARLVDTKWVTRVSPPLLLPADPFFDLAGEEFGRRLLLTTAHDGNEYCLRPDFTLPIASAYLNSGFTGTPAAYGYFGPIFRQREDGPEEFDQAGIELLGQPDPDEALDQVINFARWALEVYDVDTPDVRLGGVALFEALLAAADMPDSWRARIRHRFGHPEALNPLLDRLSEHDDTVAASEPIDRAELVDFVSEALFESGLSPLEGRHPEEIADRYLEKQMLAAGLVPARTVELIRAYLAVHRQAQEALDEVEGIARQYELDLAAPIAALRKHAMALAALSPKGNVFFDASFSPRLDYYTGIVFEMTGAAGDVLASGGQYDRLLERLGAPAPIAASGCAVWVDRLEREAENAP